MGSRSGGALKRAHGRLKLAHMHYVVSWKEDLSRAQDEEAKRKRLEEALANERDLMQKCVDIEGSDNFFAWYDSPQVPEYGPTDERIAMIASRLSNLQSSTNQNEIQGE